MNRGLLHLLLCLLLVVTSMPAWAHCRPETRVGGSPAFSSGFASQENVNPIVASAENPGCSYDFASGLHKYLYTEGDPVDNDDPSGHDIGLDINLSSILAPISSLLYAGIGVQELSFVSSLGVYAPPMMVDVYVWDHALLSHWSIGHVMCTEHGSTKVILSQFPFTQKVGGKEGTYIPGWGYNRKQDFGATFASEKRQPNHEYTISVPDPADFDAMAAKQRATPFWHVSPHFSDQTQCSVAVWLSLEAGKVPFESGQVYTANSGGTLLPNTVDKWLGEDAADTATTGVKQDF